MYLNRFLVSQIKIDRAFVSNILERRDRREFVKTVSSIMSALEFELVVEGVGPPAQAVYQSDHGSKLTQVYFLADPCV